MYELIKMVMANWLLNIYFVVDRIAVTALSQELYPHSWPLYEWLYRAAVRVSPYDIPPIYEGINHG